MSSYSLKFSVLLRDSKSKFPSSKCVNVVILPAWYFENVAYGMYDTLIRIVISNENGYDVYANTIEKLSSKTTLYEDPILCLCGT